MLKAAWYVLALGIAVAVATLSVQANAGTVSGVFTSRKGTPLSDHQLHFENRVSGDIYLARTGSDGSFSAELPPGSYDLRAERGLIIAANLVVDGGNQDIGHVYDGAPLDVRRPFEREGIGPALVQTAAPATAHLHSGQAKPASPAPTPGASPPPATSAATAGSAAPSR